MLPRLVSLVEVALIEQLTKVPPSACCRCGCSWRFVKLNSTLEGGGARRWCLWAGHRASSTVPSNISYLSYISSSKHTSDVTNSYYITSPWVHSQHLEANLWQIMWNGCLDRLPRTHLISWKGCWCQQNDKYHVWPRTHRSTTLSSLQTGAWPTLLKATTQSAEGLQIPDPRAF